MSTDSFIPALFGFTLFALLAYGVWQWWRTREAKRTHEHSAMASTSQRDEGPNKTPGHSNP